MTPLRLALSAALLGSLAACGEDPAAAEVERLAATAPDPDAARVEVAVLQGSDARLVLDLPGEVVGSEDSLLASPAGGYVEAVHVEEGDDVRKGQVLVELDGELRRAQLAQAQAQLAQAKADLDRAERLGDLATEAQLSGLRTQVQVAEANVRIARNQLDRAVIRAPFAGTVGVVAVEEGEVANPGSPVVRLVALDPIVVNLSVSDRDVVALDEGLAARVEVGARAGFRDGTIHSVAPVADLSTRSFLVEVQLPNPARDLLPGMIARVEVDRTLDRDAIVLPQDWLVTKLDGYGVYVAEEGVARWREVALGEIVRGQVIVTDGLQRGDRVVVTGQHGLVEGERLLVAREGTCCTDGRAVFTPSTADAR